MSDTERDDVARYQAAAHAMQSGVAMRMQVDPGETEPKHLRVGVNSAMAQQLALAELLIAKGVFTREEYIAAQADAMEKEAANYERLLSEHYGNQITLH